MSISAKAINIVEDKRCEALKIIELLDIDENLDRSIFISEISDVFNANGITVEFTIYYLISHDILSRGNFHFVIHN